MATSFGTTDQNALTWREIQVLRLMADGHTAGEIATQIKRSESTVRSHMESLRSKMGARNGRHAITLGHAAGYLPGEVR